MDAPTFVFALPSVYQNRSDDPRLSALRAYLAHELRLEVAVVIEPDYDAQITALRAGALDAGLFGTYAFYLAQREAGAEVLAVNVTSGEDETMTYQSAIVVVSGTPLHTLPDLRGAVIGLVDRGSTSGYLIPRRMLREAGLDPDVDVETRLLASHQAVAEAVASGAVRAGGLHRNEVARSITRHGKIPEVLRIIALSAPVPKGPVAVRSGLDRDTRQRLLQALLRMHTAAPDAASLLLTPGSYWRPASHRDVTGKTIAALTGVSYTTVSRAISGRGRVARETVSRVMDTVHDLGYRPNPTAVALAADRTDLVGMVVQRLSDARMEQYATGLRRGFAEAGVSFVLCPTDGDRYAEIQYLRLLDEGRFAGIVLTDWSRDTPDVSKLAAAGHVLMMLDVPAGLAPVTSVAPDRDAIVSITVGHLRSLGHTRIAGLVTPPWRGALRRHLEVSKEDEGEIVEIDEKSEDVSEIAASLLARVRPPTAVICSDDYLALALYQIAHAYSMTIPTKLSIVALADGMLSGLLAPPLTAVQYPLDLLGSYTAALMIARLRMQESPLSISLPAPAMILRMSTAPLG